MTTNKSHANTETLRAIYADLARIGEYADDNIVLHTAERGVAGQPAQVFGKEAVIAKELELIRRTGNTLVMEVQEITANNHFGAVLGILRARLSGSDVAMPFCGLWRFNNGRVVEHWENAYDPAALRSELGSSLPR
jgi:ketosteroid isomerase-like protein